ncbi:MAG: DUF2795 domain-containing protein [Streptosporangiales bacterium]|nr:DUF2795 domain-containing protein [Streptosporangiales bacterium]
MGVQGSDKHGPIKDEVLKEETEAVERGGQDPRAHEWRQGEPSAEDEPAIRRSPEEERTGGTPPGMSSGDVADRSELARWLQPGEFPSSAERISAAARDLNAPDHVLAELAALPQDRVYRNVQEIWQDLGGGTEDVSHRS